MIIEWLILILFAGLYSYVLTRVWGPAYWVPTFFFSWIVTSLSFVAFWYVLSIV